MATILASEIGPQWWWLNIGILLLAGILRLNAVPFRPRTGLALVVGCIFLVVGWIAVAAELKA